MSSNSSGPSSLGMCRSIQSSTFAASRPGRSLAMSVMEADGPAVLDEIVILAMTSGAPTVAERPLRWRLHDAKDGRLACLAALTVPERQPGLWDTVWGPP